LSERAEALARKFEQANDDAIATVDKLSDEQWQKTSQEGWTIAACAHHVSSSHEGIAQWIGGLANGVEIPPASLEDFKEPNAKHAAEFSGCSKAEVLDQLRTKGPAAAAAVRALSDAQLDRRTVVLKEMPPMSVQDVIEGVLIGHVVEHIGSVKAATA
jgi:uncharacterized damage-inducible protein DinB